MPNAQKLPRKHLTQVHQAQDDLRLMAQQARRALEQLESPNLSFDALLLTLREIESSAYRIALGLAELRFTDDCTGCPCAPSSTPSMVYLMVLADELERQAHLARQMVSPASVALTSEEEILPFLVEKVAEFSHVEFPLGALDGEG